MAIPTTEFTSDALLRSVRRKAFMPINDETFSDDDILEMATEELRAYCVPLLKSINEEYLVRYYDYTTATMSNNRVYALPERCTGEVLKDVQYSDSSGSFMPMTRVEPENSFRFDVGAGSSGGSSCYYLQDDNIVLNAAPNFATLRIRYFMRPSKLVKLELSTVVASYTALTRLIGVTLDLTTPFYTHLVAVPSWKLDIIRPRPGFRSTTIDLTTSYVTGTAPLVVYTGTVPTGDPIPAVNDIICLAGESCFPQIPVDMHPLLAQRTAMRMLEGKNSAGYALLAQELVASEGRLRGMLENRVEGGSRFIHNYQSAAWKSARSTRRIR